MPGFLKKWLAVYDEEVALFGWAVLLLFLLSAASVIFNNYAETAFLKRFGVKHLPVIYMLNSALTFIIMGLLAGIMARLPGIRLLTYILVFFGGSVAALRFIIPFEFKLLYPLLFILKAQYAILLGLLFWNLANDLFNTRQAKRLFPLITAGGVVGAILGSAGTPILAAFISMDNLTIVYGAIMLLAALATSRMGARFPTLLVAGGKTKKGGSRPSVMKQFRDVVPLVKGSALVGVLILLTLVPNVIIPILNYQFNFAIDSQFATETGMVRFFGYFRSFMSAVSLILLFFVSKAYSRWGLPVALMFHPLNYMLVFVAFLLRFDVFSAMYARLSTTVIRTTLNKPVTDILMGIFPVSYRAVLRPFLRGTVVRIGLFAGSGIILLTDNVFHPKYLSLVMLPFVATWFFTTLYLKRNYARILAGLLSKNMVDLKSLEPGDVKDLFTGREAQKRLTDSFLAMRGPDALWYAQLMKTLNAPDLNNAILAVVGIHNDETRIGLLNMISGRGGGKAITVLAKFARAENRPLAIAALRAVRRFKSETGTALCRTIYEMSPYPEMKAVAAAGYLGSASGAYRKQIDAWLISGEPDLRLAGVIGTGESGDIAYRNTLTKILESKQEQALLPHALKSLSRLDDCTDNSMVAPFLEHPQERVRLAALNALRIDGGHPLQQAIALLGDSVARIRTAAREKIEAAPYQSGRLLIEALNEPDKKLREGIFKLLVSLDIKVTDTVTYVKNQLEICYRCLVEADALRQVPKDRYTELLADHLTQRGRAGLEDLMRVVSLQDKSGGMRTIFKGLFSDDNHQQANAREALENVADRALLKVFMPLVDNTTTARIVAIGRQKFKLPDFHADLDALYTDLFHRKNWVTVVLALHGAANHNPAGIAPELITRLTASTDPHVRRSATQYLNRTIARTGKKETDMEPDMSIPDKILYLKKIDIFRNMPVNELAAIASITEKVMYPAGKVIFRQGDATESMYMIVTGEIAATTDADERPRVFKAGDSFGGAVLLTDDVSLFSARTLQAASLLMIHKREFVEIVRDYPQIALDISKRLCEYVKELWPRATNRSNIDGNSIFNGPAGIDRSGQ